jgi:hypothetical protein
MQESYKPKLSSLCALVSNTNRMLVYESLESLKANKQKEIVLRYFTERSRKPPPSKKN